MPDHNPKSTQNIDFEAAGKRASAAPASESAEGAILPCLSSNNSTESSLTDPTGSPALIDFKRFSTQHKKSACALAWNVEFLAEKYGLERLGFLTLTFAQDIKNPKEAQRRFNSLATHVLRTRYLEYIRVWERTKKGRIHYHLLVVLTNDIRTGFNFLEAEFGIYKDCLLYTSPSPRDRTRSRMPSSA